ncbi:MAG: flagellar biosynthesis protein FlhB [Spirochaetales bacterium]|nr:MAG: flagellar biosynthesis protein FlhB [Spirochaetales bacterium]
MRDKKAAAVAYTPGEYAPRVLARGRGETAEALCRIAARNGVPVVESPDLANSLMALNPFDSIPEEYWTAVAEILRFVYETRGNDELH